MKTHKRTITILLIIAAVLFTSCALPPFAHSGESVDFSTLPQPVNEWLVEDGITMHLLQDEYPVGTKTMTVVIENRSDRSMLYGEELRYEKWVDGNWTKVEEKGGTAFHLIGYTSFDHSRSTFTISTNILKEPLSEGLYRVIGCDLLTAPDDENLTYKGNGAEERQPYQLEFYIKRDAHAEDKQADPWPNKLKLPDKEDWEWYAPYVPTILYENHYKVIWFGAENEAGVEALCWTEGDYRTATLDAEGRLKLDIFDRKTGEIFNVITEAIVKPGDNTLIADEDFIVETDQGLLRIICSNGTWIAVPNEP